MALEKGVRPLAQCLRCTRHDRILLPIRSFSVIARAREETDTQTPAQTETAATSEAPKKTRKPLDPETVALPRKERKLIRETGQYPIGSRRRRRALQQSPNIPFAELPYQCFQEARKVLDEDRKQKLAQIELYRARIAKLQDKVVVDEKEQAQRDHQLRSMRTKLEHTKILADINDPIVKKRFEDGLGDMNKPIYRHLADQKWRQYERRILMQRLETMHVVPDVLPSIDPTVPTSIDFAHHGEMVKSRESERPPVLQVQRYEKGEKLYTIAVINPDVPDVENDAFRSRAHFLACNIPLSPTKSTVRLGRLSMEKQVVIPWLPAYAQRGLPYQRMCVVVYEQPAAEKPQPGSNEVPPSVPLDVSVMKEKIDPERLDSRFLQSRHKLVPVGADMWRTQWDEGTAGVMKRAGVIGWDVEFKPKRIEPLPYQRLKGSRYR